MKQLTDEFDGDLILLIETVGSFVGFCAKTANREKIPNEELVTNYAKLIEESIKSVIGNKNLAPNYADIRYLLLRILRECTNLLEKEDE